MEKNYEKIVHQLETALEVLTKGGDDLFYNSSLIDCEAQWDSVLLDAQNELNGVEIYTFVYALTRIIIVNAEDEIDKREEVFSSPLYDIARRYHLKAPIL